MRLERAYTDYAFVPNTVTGTHRTNKVGLTANSFQVSDEIMRRILKECVPVIAARCEVLS